MKEKIVIGFGVVFCIGLIIQVVCFTLAILHDGL